MTLATESRAAGPEAPLRTPQARPLRCDPAAGATVRAREPNPTLRRDWPRPRQTIRGR